MSIQSREELENTRAKLKLLEDQLAVVLTNPDGNSRVHEWTVRSLKQTINQMKEEMVRFESRAKSAAENP